MELTAVPRKSAETTTRTFDDLTVVVELDSSRLHSFNAVGSFIWERIDGARSAGEIATDVGREFEAAPAVIEADVGEFLDQLLERGLISA